METRLIVFCLVMTLAFACLEDDSPKEPANDEQESENTLKSDMLKVDASFRYCDSVAVVTSSGTSCCVSGPTIANPGDILEYHYQINQLDPQIYWEILQGDIVIIGSQDTHTVTVKFGPNFISGSIQGKAKGNPVNGLPTIACEEAVNITAD